MTHYGDGDRVPCDAGIAADPDVLVYRISGAFFFGAASAVGTVLDSTADTRKAFVIDFTAVPFSIPPQPMRSAGLRPTRSATACGFKSLARRRRCAACC